MAIRLDYMRKMRIFCFMKATLSELHRETAKVIGPVIDGGKTVDITEHGEVRARIVPVPRLDRKAAWKALKEIGPVQIKPRK